MAGTAGECTLVYPKLQFKTIHRFRLASTHIWITGQQHDSLSSGDPNLTQVASPMLPLCPAQGCVTCHCLCVQKSLCVLHLSSLSCCSSKAGTSEFMCINSACIPRVLSSNLYAWQAGQLLLPTLQGWGGAAYLRCSGGPDPNTSTTEHKLYFVHNYADPVTRTFSL